MNNQNDGGHEMPEPEDMYAGQEIPDAEVVPPTTAVATRPKEPAAPTEKTMTPAQAKVDAIASLTMSAYAKASELKLTPEEIAGLEEQFPDEAFKPGAAGKENLLYLEHAFIRERFNKVFGHGQWAIVPRNRWGEDFIVPATRDRAEQPATRIYVEAMLLVRGCFVGEAVGDMVYYPKNQSQNYGDAVEGAKTAALRRCAKELGVGLQAWKKDWCAGWWERENAKRRAGRGSQNAPGASGGSGHTTPAPKAQPAPQSATRPAAKTSDVAPPAEADKDQRFRFLAALSDYRTAAMQYFVAKKWLTDTQALEALPNQYVPTTKKQYDSIMAELKAFMDGDQVTDTEAWRTYLMPWGKHKDTPLGELDKKYLFGLFMNYEVEREYNGNPKDPAVIAKDEELRKMLDDAGVHYDWKKESQ